MNDAGQPMGPVFRRGILSLGGFLVLLAAVMFLPGGMGWTKGWVFFSVYIFQMALATLYLWRTNPEVFIARSKIHAGTKGWDKVIFSLLMLSFMAIFLVAGLDNRFHWSSVPAWLIVLGYVSFSMGMAGAVWVCGINKFAEPGVRIQTDRGHKVIDSGPYAIVRHPLYAISFFMLSGIPLALGSFWALIPVAIGSLALLVRTAWEDRMLQEELEGYKEYAAKVRYRLIPGVW